jgi:hypothetical protein
MSIGILLMLILSSLLMVLASPKAEAQTTESPCQAEFETLRQAIDAADFTNDRDRTKLIGKVNEAERKLAEGKNADAEQKIRDIQFAVDTLAGAGKLNPDHAAVIDEAAEAAVACIAGTPSA